MASFIVSCDITFCTMWYHLLYRMFILVLVLQGGRASGVGYGGGPNSMPPAVGYSGNQQPTHNMGKHNVHFVNVSSL